MTREGGPSPCADAHGIIPSEEIGMAIFAQDLDSLVAQLNQSTSGSSAGSSPAVSDGLSALLAQAAQRGASDLLLIAGAPPILRISGRLHPLTDPILDEEDTRELLLPLLTSRQFQDFQRDQAVDICFERPGLGRFRANLHQQRGTLAGSLRVLPNRIPTLESLHLPAGLRRLAEARQGLVLVTGATGSGKSSTLAALLDIINGTRQDHIVTIEDPVEYVHANRQSFVEQIEVGRDTPGFANSLRSLLRQTPDVVLVGEMRDPETMATALTAAETGHLVLSTLHTNDASQTVSRILDSFPQGNQPQIRQQLSLALLAIVSQQLVPTADGSGRWPAVEYLAACPAIRNIIRKGDDHMLYSALSTSRAEGMHTMEQHLAELVKGGRITRDTALTHAFRPEELKRYL